MRKSMGGCQLIISGFHRSGTSLSMQALYKAGLYLGNNLMPAHPSNPDGHFENLDIVTLHNEILHSQGRQWDSRGGAVSPAANLYESRACAILDCYMSDSRVWGFKDPRACLFLDWWHSMLPDPGAVLVFRHYISCYQSLRNREAQILAFNPKSSLRFWQDPLAGLQLWLDYNQAILEYARSTPASTLLVSCEAMLSGYNLVTAVNDKFGLSLNQHADSGIRPNVITAANDSSLLDEIPAELRHVLDDTLEELTQLAESPTAARAVPVSRKNNSIQQESANTRLLLTELGLVPHAVQNEGEGKGENIWEKPVQS